MLLQQLVATTHAIYTACLIAKCQAALSIFALDMNVVKIGFTEL